MEYRLDQAEGIGRGMPAPLVFEPALVGLREHHSAPIVDHCDRWVVLRTRKTKIGRHGLGPSASRMSDTPLFAPPASARRASSLSQGQTRA